MQLVLSVFPVSEADAKPFVLIALNVYALLEADAEPFSGIFLPFRWALNASAFWEADAKPFGDLLVAAVGDGSVSGLKSSAKVMKLPDC